MKYLNELLKFYFILFYLFFTLICPVAVQAVNGQSQTEETEVTAIVLLDQEVYCSNDVPKDILNNQTITSTLTINNDLTIYDLNVRLYIRHSSDRDLDVYLTSPNGTEVELFTDVGYTGDNFGSTCSPLPDCIIDDQAETNIASGSAPFIGSYQSESLMLDAFNGENARGTWTLSIADDYYTYSGTLDCWCLEIEPALPNDVGVVSIDEPGVTTALGSSASVLLTIKNYGTISQSNFPVSYQINSDAPVSETFSGTLEPQETVIFSFATPWTPPALGPYTITASTELTGDEKPENDAMTKSVDVTTASTYCSGDVPRSITDSDTTRSTLVINTDLIIGDVNVRLFINHTYDQDLDVFLSSPNGTYVELFSDIGGSANHFGSTCSPLPDCIIDDQAETNISDGSAPFVGSYQSESLMLSTFNGENAKGTWILTVVDDASGDYGTLNCWCLEIEKAPPNDVGVTAMDLPKLVLLGESIPINVVVANLGSETQTDFPVSYKINDGLAVTENFAGSLESGTSATITFSEMWEPQAEGTYRFTAWTALSGDANATNDTLPGTKEVVVRQSNAVPVISGIGNYTVRAGVTRRVRFSAIDADGDSMSFNISTNPGFLSISGFSQSNDTATATLVIATRSNFTGSYTASIEVRDQFDATASITFTVQVVPRVLNPPVNLTASFSQNAVQLVWDAPVIIPNTPYAGIWTGTTSQNLPVYMSVTDDGFIDSLNVRFKTYWVGFTCTMNYARNTFVEIKGDTFDAFLSVPITSVSTTLHGSFSSESNVSGTYDGSSGGGFIITGSGFTFQIGGTQLSAGTWQASKTTPGGGSQLPVLLGYEIYRSTQPNAQLSGAMIGDIDANSTTFTDLNPGDGIYYYQVVAQYDMGVSDPTEDATIQVATDVAENTALPTVYALQQNYPNPFNPDTEIRFQLPKANHVVLRIFNIIGEEIRTLVDAPYAPGYHSVRWDGRDRYGNLVASGLYFYQFQAGNFSSVKKMSIVR